MLLSTMIGLQYDMDRIRRKNSLFVRAYWKPTAVQDILFRFKSNIVRLRSDFQVDSFYKKFTSYKITL